MSSSSRVSSSTSPLAASFPPSSALTSSSFTSAFSPFSSPKSSSSTPSLCGRVLMGYKGGGEDHAATMPCATVSPAPAPFAVAADTFMRRHASSFHAFKCLRLRLPVTFVKDWETTACANTTVDSRFCAVVVKWPVSGTYR